jgi:hypothetical protein
MQQYLGRPVLLIGQVIASPIGSGEVGQRTSPLYACHIHFVANGEFMLSKWYRSKLNEYSGVQLTNLLQQVAPWRINLFQS